MERVMSMIESDPPKHLDAPSPRFEAGSRGRRAKSLPRRETPSQRPTESTLLMSPRIAVGEDVATDMARIRATGRPVVITDGEQELVAVVPIELYREMLAALAHLESEPTADHTPRHTPPVLEPDELDALLAEWDVTGPPRPVLPPDEADDRHGRRANLVAAAPARITTPLAQIPRPVRPGGEVAHTHTAKDGWLSLFGRRD